MNPTGRTAIGDDRKGFAFCMLGLQRSLRPQQMRELFHRMVEVVPGLSLTYQAIHCRFDRDKGRPKSLNATVKTWRKKFGEREDWTRIASIVIAGSLPEGARGLIQNMEFTYNWRGGYYGRSNEKPQEHGDCLMMGVRRHPDASPEEVEDIVLDAARRFAEIFSVETGIGFWRPTLQCAIFNASQLWVNEPEDMEEERIDEHNWKFCNRWSPYLRGMFPCVTRWNFLAGPQSKAEVEGTPLIEWIRGSSDRGQLKPIGKNSFDESVYLWIVEPARCRAIEAVLDAHGMIAGREEVQRMGAEQGHRPYYIWQEDYNARYARLVDDVVEPVVQSGEYDCHFVLVRRPLSDLVDEETGQQMTDDERVCDIIIAGRDRKLYLIEIVSTMVIPEIMERKLRSMMRNIPEHRRGGWRVIDYEQAKAIAGWPAGEPPVE